MSDFPDLSSELERGLSELGLDMPSPARTQLLEYLALLHRWNGTYNLSAVRSPREMLVRHVFDSLAPLPWLHGARVADVGSGPGLPGIPMALARDDLTVLMIDSNGKKARFMREAVRHLALQDRCSVLQARSESLAPAQRYDTVVSRAFATLGDFVEASRGLIAPDGRWLAMKGRRPDEEIATLPADVRVEAVRRLTVPDLAGERHAVIMLGPAPGVRTGP